MKIPQPRFSFFLVALLLLAVLNPLLIELGLIRAQILLNLSFGYVFLTGLYMVSQRKGVFFFLLSIVIVATILNIINQYQRSYGIDLTLQLMLAAFLVTLIIVILQKRVLVNERVTWEKIAAALCVYLLAGYFWACLYTFADRMTPGSFSNNLRGYPDLLYYSLITLATVGYGDITPVTPFARSLSVLEAISGQFYLAVMIARLVGLQIVHSDSSSNPQ